MNPIKPEERLVCNVHRAVPRYFDSTDKENGVSYIPLDEKKMPGTGLYLYVMEPGSQSAPHEHGSDEYFYIIEGDLTDHDGTKYQAGDMACLRAGTRHFSHSENGCRIIVFSEKDSVNL